MKKSLLNRLRKGLFLGVAMFAILGFGQLQAQDLCVTDTSFTDVIFLIDNSQSIDDLEYDAFEDVILRSIQKVQDKCQRSQIGVVHYGGAFGRETSIEYNLSTNNVFTEVSRQFCTSRNSSGFCSAGGGDDLNHAVGEIIDAIQDGSLSRNRANKLQLVIFTDAFGFDANCGFINCSVIRPFTNIDLLKTQFGGQITVVGASSQAEASLLAIYASPGGTFDNTDLFEDCEGTVDGCQLPRKYIPIEFNSPIELTSDNVLNCVGCEISISQAINPQLGANRSVCGDLGESAMLSANVPDAVGNLTYNWSADLPNQQTVIVRPTVTTTYKVTATDGNGCTGIDSVTVFVESCAPDCSPDTSFSDILFLVDNSQSIDDSEFVEFEGLILESIRKVREKCVRSQRGLMHYGGAFGQETRITFPFDTGNRINDLTRQFCTSRNSAGFCSEGGGDDLNSAVGDIIVALENGTLNRNPTNKLQLVIFTDAFGFDANCGFINCSVIRPFNNVDILKSQYGAQVTVVGVSAQAESSLLAIYASPGGDFDNTDLFEDCEGTVDGCQLPRKYIPVDFNSQLAPTSDKIVSCIGCEIEVIEQVNATLGAEQTICSDVEDDMATLTAVLEDGVAPFSYEWSGNFPNQQTITVRPPQTTAFSVTITDANGCIDQATINVVVEDCIPDCVVPPVFVSCPSLYQTCPGESIDPALAGQPEVRAGSDACPVPTVTFSDQMTSLVGCNQVITRTWTASYPGLDDPTLVATCVQEIQLTDRDAPSLTDIPDDIVINSDATCSAAVTWTEPIASDNCGLRSVTSSIPNGSRFDGGTTTVMYTAIDQCGNITMGSFTVTVVEQCCTEPPVITCVEDYSGCPGSSVDPEVTGRPFASGGTDCPDIEFSFTDSRSTGTDGCTVTIARTWRATYAGLNNSTLVDECIQILTLADGEAPVIVNLPEDITIDSDQSCTALVSWMAPIAQDNCEVSSVTSDRQIGSRFDVGTTVVTYTATDICGNTSTASFNVTVIERCCTTPPIITCPINFNSCPSSSTDPAVTGIATAEPGSPDCPTPTISFEDDVVTNDANCITTITRTWRATYPGETDINLTSTCTQTITLSDTEAPSFTTVPQDITVDSDQSCTASVRWESPTATDACDQVTITSDIANGSTFDVGVTVVTFTATDACGNTATASFNITVIEKCCTVPPILTCVETFRGCPGTNIDPGVTGVAKAEPGSADCPEPTVSFSDETVTSEDGCTVTIMRTWRALYTGAVNLDLSTECTQMIILSDDEGPAFTNLPANIIVDSDDNCVALTTWPAITATDNCDVREVTTDIPSGSIFDLGVTTVTATATDLCGNTTTATFTVTVNKMCCTDAPIITCPGDFTGCPNADIDPSNIGFATAAPGGPECPTPSLTFVDEVVSEDGCRRVINRIWSAAYPGRSDEDLVTSCIQTITLDDTDAPTIENLPFNVTLPSTDVCNVLVTWDPPTASDNCGVSSIISDIPSGSIFEIGITTVTYTATDLCGNITTASFTVTVTQACCLDAPIITCPVDFAGCPGADISPEETGMPSAFGGGPFCGDPIVSFSDEVISEGPCDGQLEILRTWTARAPGNDTLMATCTQRIVLGDDIAPELFNCPESVTLDPDDPIYTWIDPIGIDECEVTITSNFESGSVFPTGINTVVITATDGCGNEAVCTFDVVVPPEVEITCPDDIMVRCLDTLILADLPAPMIDTDCAECTADNIEGFDYIGIREGVSYYISERPKNWRRARTIAQELGGQLAVINSEEENNFLRSILPVNAAYIGLSDIDEEGEFKWVDGTPLTYTNWFKDQPNDYGHRQDYVEFLANGEWNDQSNNKSLPFIIEVECVTVTREVIATEELGNTTTYTIQYSAVDRCGTDDECTFTVTSDNSPQFVCPQDTVITVPYGWSKVTWDQPVYESCCTVCIPKQIRGYIYMGNIGDSYYYCSAGRASWKAAERRAKEIGGTLAVIETAEENEYISSRLIQRVAYVGLTDREREGRFKWVNGTNADYTSWGAGRPTGAGDFVSVDEHGDWTDENGLATREFVVEIKGCNNVEQIEGPAPGSTFRLGTTTVTYRAEDGCGGSAECSFTVTVTTGEEEVTANGRSIEGEEEATVSLDDRSLQVYPNPATDRLFLNITGATDQVADVSVFRADGQRVSVHQINAVKEQGIDVSTMVPGVHLLRITYNDGETMSQSFIVQ